MTILHKVEMYILDINENYESVTDIIEDCKTHTDVDFACFNRESVEVKWDDNIDLNYIDCDLETYRKYFCLKDN
jgi:hypothetical protein